jgi:hypothetical protein
MSLDLHDHRDAAKELRRLPATMRDAFTVVRNELAHGAVPADLHETIPRGRGRRRRLFYVWGRSYQGTTYRMAWEVRRALPRSGEPDQVVVWAYGPHEGFYDRSWQRAKA